MLTSLMGYAVITWENKKLVTLQKKEQLLGIIIEKTCKKVHYTCMITHFFNCLRAVRIG